MIFSGIRITINVSLLATTDGTDFTDIRPAHRLATPPLPTEAGWVIFFLANLSNAIEPKGYAMSDMLISMVILAGLYTAIKLLNTSPRQKRHYKSRRFSPKRKLFYVPRQIDKIAQSFATFKYPRLQTQVCAPSPTPSPPPDIEVTCHNCQCVLSAPLEMAGHDATCESCRAIVKVPPLPPQTRPSVTIPPVPAPLLTPKLLRDLEWRRLEEVTAAYFEQIGWSSKLNTFGSDGGIDIKLVRLNDPKATAIVQCKAWNDWKVGVKEIREFYGVLTAESISKGYFVISGDFTEEARSFAQRKPLTLISGNDLIARIALLPDLARRRVYSIAIAGDYATPSCPRCGHKMVRRIGARGRSDGKPFWGCRHYPHCRGILKSRAAT